MIDIAGEGLEDSTLTDIENGNLDVMSKVLSSHGEVLKAWVTTKCPPGIDPDDIIQETFITAFKNISSFIAGTNFRAWLFTLAKYKILNEYTRIRRNKDNNLKYRLHILDQNLFNQLIQDSEQNNNIFDHLTACVNELKDSHRELIYLRYDLQLSNNEISERLKRSVTAIKKVTFLIRKNLKNCIELKSSKGTIS